MQIFQIILPIFGIIGIGYWLRRRHLVDQTWVHILNQYIYYVALPALIVVSFWKINWFDSSIASILGFNTLALLLFAAFIAVVLKTVHIDRKTKAAIFLTALVGNTIYMGFPLVESAIGRARFNEVVAAGTAHLALGIAFSIVVTELYVLKTKNYRVYILDFFKNPLVISMIAGFLLSRIHIPLLGQPALKLLEMLGATASPVALFALGGFLHGKFIKHHMWFALLPVMLKLIAFPIFIFLFAILRDQPANAATTSTLIAGMPTAVTAFVVAEKYKLNQDFVANCILLSTLASIATITVFLFVL
jgi:predicted permease